MHVWFILAWRNLWRQKRRSLITASAMAVGVALSMSLICINDGTYQKFFEVMVEGNLGHIQVHHPDYPGKRSPHDTIENGSEVLASIRGTEGVKHVSVRAHGAGLLGSDVRSEGAQLVGIDPEAEAAVTKLNQQVKQGEYLDPAAPGEILIGQGLFDTLEIELGGTLVAMTQASDGSIGNALYTVRGTFETGSVGMDRGGAYMLLTDLQELLVLKDSVHELTIVLDNGDAMDDYVADLSQQHPTLLVRSWEEVSPQTATMLASQDAIAFITLFLVFFIAAFGVVNTMLVSVFERTRELGVMRAMGVSPRQLVGVVVLESLWLGTISGVAGVLLGLGLDLYLVQVGLDFSASIPDGFDFNGVRLEPVLRGVIRPTPILLTVFFLVAVSVLAALWPALRAALIRPIDAIRQD
jgi:ABC-type lipoprotein release transport system permease subunit